MNIIAAPAVIITALPGAALSKRTGSSLTTWHGW
jgi:hypothetical protein